MRDAVASLPQSKLDQIINEELTKIIQERLNSSKIIISTEKKKLMLEKYYQPSLVEDKIYKAWENEERF